MRTIQADHPNHPDHLDPLTTRTTRTTKTNLTTLVSPTLNSNLRKLQTYCLEFANKFSVTTICKKKVRSDILQKNCLEQELAKKKFSRPPIFKKDVRNSLINLTSLLFCLITLEYWLVIQSCQRSLWYNPTTSNHSFPRAGESEISLGAKKEKVFVQTDFKFTKYFWFAEKIVLFFEITRCTLLLKKTTAVDSISLFVVGALANCNQERPSLRLISLLNSLLCWNFYEVLKFQSFDYLNSTSYIVLLPRTFTQPQQPRNIVRCESNFFSLSDWALPVQEEKI